MAKAKAAFEANADSFDNYDKELRGYIRYAILYRNLEPLLKHSGLSIADIGGGAAKDAIWAAGLGHTVTVVEPAAAQLAIAKQRLKQQSKQIQTRVTLVRGTIDDLAEYAGQYDIVFCHCVAMYLDEPGPFFKQLAELLKSGGYLSVLEKGYYGSEARLIAEQKFQALKRLQRTRRVFNNQGYDVWAFQPTELENLLKVAGTDVVDWSGVRLITEMMRDNPQSFKTGALEHIVTAEYEHGHHTAIRAQGQLLHFVAQKPTTRQ